MKIQIIAMSIFFVGMSSSSCAPAGTVRLEKIPVDWQFDPSLVLKGDAVPKSVELIVPVDASGMIEQRTIVEKVAWELGIKPQSCLLFLKNITGAVTPLCSWSNKNPRYISRCFGKRIALSRLQKGETLLVRVLEVPRYRALDADRN